MKYKGMKVLGLLGATTVATLVGAEQASAIVSVDDFSDTDQGVIDNNPFGSDNEADSAAFSNSDILGNDQRDLLVKGDSSSDTIQAQVDSSNKNLSISTNSGDSGTFTLTYDGDGDATSLTKDGFDDFDITQNGANDALFFDVIDTDTNTNLTINLYSNDGTENASLTDSFGGSTGEQQFELSSFTDNTGNFDPESVSAIQYEIDVADSGDLGFQQTGFNSTTAVPFEAETSIALALLGSWGAWKYRKNRRTQSNVS